MFDAADFEAWWAEARPEGTAEALLPRVRDVHRALVARRLDLAPLKDALLSLLSYLAAEGRTAENCRVAEAFLCLLTAEHSRLVDRLPRGAWQDLVDDLGIDLAASLSDPDLAEQAGTSPERMLERARALSV